MDAVMLTNGYSYFGGGGVWIEGGTVTNCIITGCWSTNAGGGAYQGGGIRISGTGTVANCLIQGNIASNWGGYGGGIYINSAAKALVKHCTIAENTAYRVYAGGIYAAGDTLIHDCLIVSNAVRFTESPGGNSFGGGVFISGTNVCLANCTIVGNDASIDGGGIAFSDWAAVPDYHMVFNCIIVSNTGHSGYVSPYNAYGMGRSKEKFRHLIANSCVHSIVVIQGDQCQFDLDKYGNTTNDPLFVAFSEADYRLNQSSPCVGTGVILDWMGGVDFDGNPRINPFSGLIDMGCYQWLGKGSLIRIQ